MPQDSLLPEDTRYTGLRLDLVEDLTKHGRRWILEARRRGPDDTWRLVWQGPIDGLMLDYLGTFYEEAAASFMFGERRDLARALGGVHRSARKHAAAHTL